MSFEEKYRNWLFGLAKKPIDPSEEKELDTVWNSVEEEFILDEAWSGIESGLMAEGISTQNDLAFGTNTVYKGGIFIVSAALLLTLIIFLAQRISVTETNSKNEAKLESIELKENMHSEKNVNGNTAGILPPFDNTVDEKNNVAEDSDPEATIIPEKGREDLTKFNLDSLQSLSINYLLENKSFDNTEFMAEEFSMPSGSVQIDKPSEITSGQQATKEDAFLDREDVFKFKPEFKIPESFLSYSLPRIQHPESESSDVSIPSWKLHGGGVSISYNNSWILNDETLAGLNSANLTDTRMSYAPEVGISALFASRKGQRILMELFVISDQNQRFRQYINALYQERKISLHYHKLHVSWHVPLKVIPLSAGVGAYYSLLNHAEEIIAGETTSINSLYKRDDYGLTLQLAKEYIFLDRLIFMPSLRFQYSLNNIFKGNDIIPGSLRKTNNVSAGVNLGIYYRF